ncbi:MAG TPA: tyrosine-type recombinase/integrase [Acidimicrobiales bacterium]|nr:tyrosine-type recombinase/integrase [Acidimicrobiales bacterium]
MTDAELIMGYLEHLKWRNRSVNTINIRRIYLSHLSLTLGPLAKVKPKALRAWMADPARNLEASSQSTYLSTYRSFYTWAMKERLVKKDPTLRIEMPTVKRAEPHPITDADRLRCLAEADPVMLIWLLLGSLAGCRCQEIALMRREDIRDDETMRVFIAYGKGGKSRFVPLAPALLDALNAWEMPAEGRLWALNPAQMSKAINLYLHTLDAKRVDGEPATAHSLRHWFGTKTYQASKDLRLTQILMGHSSPSTTAGYAAADMSQAAGVVNSL